MFLNYSTKFCPRSVSYRFNLTQTLLYIFIPLKNFKKKKNKKFQETSPARVSFHVKQFLRDLIVPFIIKNLSTLQKSFSIEDGCSIEIHARPRVLKIESAMQKSVNQSLGSSGPGQIDRSAMGRNERRKIRKIARTACSGTLGPEEDEANLLGKHPSLLDLNSNNLAYMAASSTSFPPCLRFAQARHYYDFLIERTSRDHYSCVLSSTGGKLGEKEGMGRERDGEEWRRSVDLIIDRKIGILGWKFYPRGGEERRSWMKFF